jgi:hypothetical protein
MKRFPYAVGLAVAVLSVAFVVSPSSSAAPALRHTSLKVAGHAAAEVAAPAGPSTKPPAAVDIAATGYPNQTVPASDPVVTSFVNQAGLSVAAAQRAAAVEEQSGKFQADSGSYLGSRYGGLYLTPVGGIVVQIVNPGASDQSWVIAEASKLGVSGFASLQAVPQSASSLAALQKRVSDVLVRRHATFNWSLITDTHSRQVKLSMGVGVRQAQIRRELESQFHNQNVRITMMAPKVRPQSAKSAVPANAASCVWAMPTYCDPPLRGGISLHPGTADEPTICSEGFNVDSNADQKAYVLTAGHCFSGYSASQVWESSCFTACADLPIGVLHNRIEINNTQDDEAIIRNASVASSGWVLTVSSGSRVGVLGTTTNTEYPISFVSTSSVDKRICYTGAVSETQCGLVTALNGELEEDGILTIDLAQADWTILNGDSGGPTYASGTAFGILCGGDEYGYSYYVGIEHSTAALGVYVVAAG